MLAEVETLLVVQERDQQIMSIQKELETIPLLVERANSRLDGDKAAVASVKEQIQANELSMKNLELDIQTRQDTITKLKVQQYETKKNEEYRSMGEDIIRYQEEVTQLEDQELEFMETGEDLSGKLAEAHAALAKTQENVDIELGQLEERKANYEKRIQELRSERASHATGVPDDLLSIYDRILTKKRDAAVVALKGQQCGGCHMKVTNTTLLNAKADKKITHCENCGRILYFLG